jgi:hypothetical protein
VITKSVVTQLRSEKIIVESTIENITRRILSKEASQSLANPKIARKSPKRSKNFWLRVSIILISAGGDVPDASSECMLILMSIHALIVIWPVSLSGLPTERTRLRAERTRLRAERTRLRAKRTLAIPPKTVQVLTLLRQIMLLWAAANVRILGYQTKTMTVVGFHARDAGQVLERRCACESFKFENPEGAHFKRVYIVIS